MAGLLRRYKSPIWGNYRKYSLLYGALTGGVLFVGILGCWLVDWPYSEPENLVTDVLLLICIFCCSYLYRQGETGGRIYLKELLVLGIGIGMVGGLAYGLSLMLYGSVIDLEFAQRCVEMRIAAMEAAIADGTSAEELVRLKNGMEATRGYSLGDWAFIGGFRTAVMSIIVTFFSSIVLKTEKNVRA